MDHFVELGGRFMAHQVNRLTARAVETATKPGLYPDGAGLYLRVGRSGAKSWCLRYMLAGKAREMGLGGASKIGLADARKRATAQRLLLVDKVDPLARREAETRAQKIEAAQAMTFEEAARGYVKAHEPSWRNAKHRQQWANTLATYVFPVFGTVPVGDVDVAMVMKVIEPLWATKPETAGRVRGRIESVLDWAKARGFREGENPARWRGHLSNLLPARSKVHKVKHHPALPYNEIGTFIADLRSRQGMAARALELLILCTARTGDIIGNDRDDKPPLKWPHIDLKERLWTIPSTKTDTEHRVPLPQAAVRLLSDMKALELGEIVFPGIKDGQPLSNMAMLNLIGRMNGDQAKRGQPRYLDPRQDNTDVTPHGFRSTFRDWAAERTNFPTEVVEMALAHAIDDKVEAAYRRGHLFDKRRRLMDAWAEFCAKPAPAGTVVNLRA
jgi:integrase